MTATAGLALHATTVAHHGRGLMIIGPSGSGKSGLALQLLALGADLVADDQTLLSLQEGALIAGARPILRGVIEARGVGLLHAHHIETAPVQLVVDLGQTETERLPPQRNIAYLGVRCDLVLGSRSSHFPAALLCYLLHGRYA